ncbi:serine hydrolase [Acetobacter farinalis]|uniref:Serine hydrolase n=1 Tax=Acetobacter farinalis TaxID=1260984 RepID=A0ABT3Q981_9PROT|nr:serine hydrolase domain-containing protein [Acetobacter farinalis]MCX2561844.1 serine hydrolase [Acetobacter farinalis]NHO30336.1 serine hydrolase [Acetobacter farinalis]
MTYKTVCLTVSSALALVLSITPALAQSRTDKAMDAVMSAAEARPLAALAAVKLQNGQPVYQYYGGFARRDGAQTVPVKQETLFRIASISKVVTTIGLMELVEQGKINLDHDVSDYLGFPLRNPDFPETAITVRMLLNHTSTIRDADVYVLPPGRAVREFFDKTHKPGAEDYHFSYHDGHAPGTYFTYCNLCYGLVGTIIERASGERFDRYQKHHVLEPLKIDGGYNVTELDHPERVATLYQHLPAGYEATVDSPPFKGWNKQALAAYRIGQNGTLFSPQGGLHISLQGLTRLARFMIQRGTLDGVRVLTPQSIEAMETPTWVFDGKNGTCPYPLSAYGLSMFVLSGAKDTNGKPDSPYAGYKGGLRGHLGDAYGLHSGFWYNPKNGEAYLFAADGFPDYDQVRPGQYSSFSRVEEKIFTALAGVQP